MHDDEEEHIQRCDFGVRNATELQSATLKQYNFDARRRKRAHSKMRVWCQKRKRASKRFSEASECRCTMTKKSTFREPLCAHGRSVFCNSKKRFRVAVSGRAGPCRRFTFWYSLSTTRPRFARAKMHVSSFFHK